MPSFIRKQVVAVDSGDALPGGRPYDYVIPIPVTRNVVGMELVAWDFPRDLAPTFVPYEGTDRPGDNKLDFTLTHAVGGTVAFEVTFPSLLYDYENRATPTRNYAYTLETLMSRLVALDATFGPNVQILVDADELERTVVYVTGVNAYAGDSVTLSFNFSTGPNAAASAWRQMGFFENTDYSSVVDVGSDAPRQVLVSPTHTLLDPWQFIDVFVDEYAGPENHLARVYTLPSVFGESFSSAVGAGPDFRTRLTTTDVSRLDKVHVRLRMRGVRPPPRQLNHRFHLAIFNSEEEIGVPGIYNRLLLV